MSCVMTLGEIMNGEADEIGGAIPLQYTGLKDKNGISIYEGDVFKTIRSTFLVVWEYDQWRGVDLKNDIISNESLYALGSIYEVIGNTYENPELLEGGE